MALLSCELLSFRPESFGNKVLRLMVKSRGELCVDSSL